MWRLRQHRQAEAIAGIQVLEVPERLVTTRKHNTVIIARKPQDA